MLMNRWFRVIGMLAALIIFFALSGGALFFLGGLMIGETNLFLKGAACVVWVVLLQSVVEVVSVAIRAFVAGKDIDF